MKILPAFLLLLIVLIPPFPTASAADGMALPEQVPAEDRSCKEIAELSEKYGAEKRLPGEAVVGGKACARSELAKCLLSILEKVAEKCEKEGRDAVPSEDLERIAALHDALKEELSRYEGYLERREAIESLLARPEVPPFLYRFGVNGFLRGEGAGNFRLPDFSYTPGHGEGRFLYRAQPYIFWHPTDYLDIHLEGQGYGFSGGNQDSHKFSLYQGFVEGKLPGKDWLALKVGRQEFSYGSAFIIGPNSFYDGLSFDAVRLRVKPLEPLSIDLLAGWYAHPFDNGLEGSLVGAYAAYALSEGGSAEAYFFSDTGSVLHHHGEHLDILGLRGTAAFGPVSVEFEPAYESGRVFNPARGANDNVSAYGGHMDITCEAEALGYHNKLLLSYAMGSGDKDAANGVDLGKEFRNPDNDTSLVGDMGAIGDLSGTSVEDHHASGLHIFTLGWGVDLTKELNFTATAHYFLADAVEKGFSRDVGLETDFTITYSIHEDLSLILGYDRFYTGKFFRDAAGRDNDVDYGYAMLQFDLAVTRLKKKP